MSEPEKITLTEDVGGDFGFRVVWLYSETWCDFEVFKYVARENGVGLFDKRPWNGSGNHVTNTEEAVVYHSGFVKSDGCCEMGVPNDQPFIHWCGANDVKMHMALLKYLYCRAMQLMNSTEDPWIADDKKLPEMKA